MTSSAQTHGRFEIYLTPKEYEQIQLAQYRNGEDLDDTLLRMAGIRPEAHRKGLATAEPFLYERPRQEDYITCGELVNLAGQGRSVFPIWVGDYEVLGKFGNLLPVLRLKEQTHFYVREYELLGANTLRSSGEVLAKLDIQATTHSHGYATVLERND